MALKSSDLKKYKYFSSLSDEALETLSSKLAIVDFPPKTEVIKEGAPGDFFYFILNGRLEVTKLTKRGQEAKLAVITSGQGFGEMSLLTGSNRFSSVRSLTKVTLYQLPKKDFEEIVRQEPAFKKMLLKKAEEYSEYNKIKVLQPFALLEPDRMYAVLSRMIEKTYSLGEDIIVQGERGDFYYVIKSGRVAVLQKKGEQEARQVALLGEGDAFGEEALIRSDPRNATCRAIEETTVYALDKVDFAQVMHTSFIDNIFVEDISTENYLGKYVVIDARVPRDYEAEHIKGAINIPMEVLREKYDELDKTKSYITYCSINDSRGMTSAFLLKNHGFNAKCLRGGVSSWEGPVVKAGGEGHLPAQG
jgi:CRP-like cAMP-binding protein/rhodanese-related sulfurtransferase